MYFLSNKERALIAIICFSLLEFCHSAMAAILPTMDLLEATCLFETAWNDPNNLAIMFDDIDINGVLSKNYVTDPPTRMTRTLLWDMERKKAADALTFLGSIVRDAKTHRQSNANAFIRWTIQRQFLNPEVFDNVLEEVFLDDANQLVTFIGKRDESFVDWKPLQVPQKQPVFYVQHGVTGQEENPMNTWRIVFINPSEDARCILKTGLGKFEFSSHLPYYVEIYLQKEMNVHIEHIDN